MELRTVLSITGKPGLFKLIAHRKNGVVVESLLDGARVSIPANANVSSLGDIAIYTYEEEVPLKDVFKAISAVTEGKEALSHKSSKSRSNRLAYLISIYYMDLQVQKEEGVETFREFTK